MLKDDTRIQLDLYANLDDRQDPARRRRALKYERELNAVFVDFPADAAGPAATYADRLPLLGHAARDRAGSAASRSARIPPGSHWINTACEGEGSSIWWPSKDQWRDEAESMRHQRRRSRTTWSTCRTAGSSARPTSATATRAGTGSVHYPINCYNVSLNIGNYVHFARPARRSAARLLRAARQPREGQGAVRPGQADDRGVREVLRRVSVQEGRLQADRSAVLRAWSTRAPSPTATASPTATSSATGPASASA